MPLVVVPSSANGRGGGRSTVYDPGRMTLARVDPAAAETAERYARLGHGELEFSERDEQLFREVARALERASPPTPLEPAPAVTRLYIGNTYHCNMGCSYCYNELDLKDRKGSEVTQGMSHEVARASIDALLEQSGTARDLVLLFIGGEPLLEREILVDSVAYARERAERRDKRLTCVVYTNGTLMNRRVIDWSNEAGVSLVISLDGPPALHDRRRVFLSGKPTSKAVLRNIRRYMDATTHDVRRVRAVSTPGLPLVALHQYLLDLGFNEIHVQALYGESGIDVSELDDMLLLLEWYREQLIAGNIISVLPFEGIIDRLVLRGRATASWYP
jgi:sulfatase maturation enzyme AslB (radical SAM superfamily)